MLGTARRRVFTLGVVIVLLMAGGSAGYLLGSRPTAVASGTARLTIFKGTVQVRPATTTISHNAVTGELLTQSDEVTTGPATWAAINFPDGSVTRMDSSSQIQITTLTQTAQGGWNTTIDQKLGKTWNRVAQLVGGSSFNVTAPNATNAEVRGTDFEVIVERQADGSYTVRVNNFAGAITVIVNGNATPVGPNQSTTVVNGATSASTPGPIPPGDLTDPFTVFNQTDNTMTAGDTTTIGNGFLTPPGSTGVQPGAGVDGNTDLDFALGWPGSTYTFLIYEPDGTLYDEQTSSKPPIHIVVPQGAVGNWTYEVVDKQSAANEAWVVIINSIRPSKQAPAPFFVVPPPPPDTPPCTHAVTAGSTDSWKVVSRDAAGKPAVTASGLPDWATFADNHDGTGTVSFAPPADSPDQVVHPTFTASFGGKTATLTECTEIVHAKGKASSISGVVSGGPGAGVTLSLSPGGAVAITAADGSYGFTGLGAGTYTVTMTVPSGYNAVGPTSISETVDGTNSAVANFALRKIPAPAGPAVSSPGSLPAGTFGGSYAYQFGATGSDGPYTFSKVSGLMPPGLRLNSSGLLFGSIDPNATPAASATGATSAHFAAVGMSPVTYTFGVQAKGADGKLSAPFTASVLVNAQPTINFTPAHWPVPTPWVDPGYPQPSPPTPDAPAAPPANGFLLKPPSAVVGYAFSQTFGVTGGTPPFTWTVSGGDPSVWGLSLSPAGLLSGTPTQAVDQGQLTVRVTDHSGASVEGQVYVQVYRAPSYDPRRTGNFRPGNPRFAEFDAGQGFNAYLGFVDGGVGFGELSLTGNPPACASVFYGEGYALNVRPPYDCTPGTWDFGVLYTDGMNAHANSEPFRWYVDSALGAQAAAGDPAQPPSARVGDTSYAGWQAVGIGGHPASSRCPAASPCTYSISIWNLPQGFKDGGNGMVGFDSVNYSSVPGPPGDYTFYVNVTDDYTAGFTSVPFTLHIDGSLLITTASLPPGADAGFAYFTTVSAVGGIPPYRWSASGLPPGLQIDPASGDITGTPTTTGTYNGIVVSVCDSTPVPPTRGPICTNTSGQFTPPQPAPYSITVYPPPTITVQPAGNAWPPGTAGQPYYNPAAPVTFTVTGGDTNNGASCFSYSWTGLPDGLSVQGSCSANGQFANLVGTPTTPGTYAGTVVATDVLGNTTTTPVSFSNFLINGGTTGPRVSGGQQVLHAAVAGHAYQAYYYEYVSAQGGSEFDPASNGGNSYTWSISPALPTGLVLKSSGNQAWIEGTPSAANPPTLYTFTATGAAPCAPSAPTGCSNQGSSAPVKLAVDRSYPSVALQPPGADQNTAYSFQLTSTTGTGPYTWSLNYNYCYGRPGPDCYPSAVPSGLTLAADGTISGTPVTPGSYRMLIQITDSVYGPSVPQNVTFDEEVDLVVAATPMTITPPAAPLVAGQGYNGSFTVTDGTPPYTWSLKSGTPPAGLAFDRFGHLTGTPASSGPAAPYTVQVTDAQGNSATLTMNSTVAAAAAKPAAPAPNPSPSPSPTPALPATPSPLPSASPRSRAGVNPKPSPTPK